MSIGKIALNSWISFLHTNSKKSASTGIKKEAKQQERTRAKKLDNPESQFAYSDQLQWDHY